MSEIQTQPATLPAPPPSDDAVTFGGGGFQTFKGALPDGVVSGAALKEWKRTVSTFGNDKPKEQFVFLFTVPGRESEGELAYYTAVKVSPHPKAKFIPFLKALGARIPTPENPRLPDDLIGRKANLFIENIPSTSDASRSYPKVIKVFAAA